MTHKKIEDFLNTAPAWSLLPFFIKYIKTHSYFKTLTISRIFLTEKFNYLPKYDLDNKYRRSIGARIGKIASMGLYLEILEKFNGKTYKIVDVSKEKVIRLENLCNKVSEDWLKMQEERKIWFGYESYWCYVCSATHFKGRGKVYEEHLCYKKK